MYDNHEHYQQESRTLRYGATRLRESTYLSEAVDLLAPLERLSTCKGQIVKWISRAVFHSHIPSRSARLQAAYFFHGHMRF